MPVAIDPAATGDVQAKIGSLRRNEADLFLTFGGETYLGEFVEEQSVQLQVDGVGLQQDLDDGAQHFLQRCMAWIG